MCSPGADVAGGLASPAIPRLALLALLAMTAADHGLESTALLAHLADSGLATEADRIRRGNGLRLSFTRSETPAGVANADFAMTLAQATARAGLVEALAEATIRFQSSLDEADWAAQQERRQEIEALDAAMMALAESRREG